MDNKDKILEKIRKLLNLQKGAQEIGSIEEAANASARIQELLLKYNLELGDIPGSKEKTNIIIHEIFVNDLTGFSKSEGDWMVTMFTIVAKHNFCKNIHMKGNPKHLYLEIIGEKHNCETVEYMGAQLINITKKLRVKALKEAEDTFGPISNKKSFYRSYGKSFAAAIAVKLREQDKANAAKYSGTNALVIRNNEAIAKVVEENYGELASSRRRTLKNKIGATLGYRDGTNTSINKGIDESRKSIDS